MNNLPIKRDRQNRLVMGVCAGLSKEFGWNLTIVRLITLLLCTTSVGVVFYFIAGALLPDENGNSIAAEYLENSRGPQDSFRADG